PSTRSRSPLISVPLPAPDGPVTTKTGRDGTRTSSALAAVVEEIDQLGPLPLGEAPDRLRLADPALVEEPRGLHPAELGDCHEHVEDLRRLDPLGRVEQDGLDALAPGLQVALELSAADPHVVRSLERLHPLVERAGGRLSVRLRRDHEPDESTKLPSRVKQ